MKSPCIKVCRIDKGVMPENGGLCIGAGRNRLLGQPERSRTGPDHGCRGRTA